MAKSFYISPTAQNSGLTSVCLGLVRALDEIGVRVGFFKPISHSNTSTPDSSIHFAKALSNISCPQAITLAQAQALISKGKKSQLLENIIQNFYIAKQNYDLIIIEGVVPEVDEAYTQQLNADIANSLDSEIILLTPITVADNTLNEEALTTHLELAFGSFSTTQKNIIGCILNKVGSSVNLEKSDDLIHITKTSNTSNALNSYSPTDYSKLKPFSDGLKLIGQIPLTPSLQFPRVIDIAMALDLSTQNSFNNNELLKERRVASISICARRVENLVSELKPGTLLITPGDRNDILLAACMATQNGTPLAGIILTGNFQPNPDIISLCRPALSAGLPIFSTKFDTFETAVKLSKLNDKVPLDDVERINNVVTAISENIDTRWLKKICTQEKASRLSPAAFRFQLSEQSRAANKTIILPEGNEPRTICAAAICHQRKLAKCILLGNSSDIIEIANAKGITLPHDLVIMNPDNIREHYVKPMTELRKHKKLSPQMALAMLEDNVVLGTMMLALNEVDGLVSGAIHTTANTVRPAFQLIKTQDNTNIVSSVFFMCLPEQVLVYGDCAINPDPNAEQLAEIAIQSADSATAFGINPKVAMISYSTGESGEGADVEKVREATRIAQAKRPDLIIDGPLQYDAAAVESVGKKKAPDSKVAGKATVFIFPDLNTGNTTYKAVQRSANVISIGPMLQGLKKPVNDLSRGALIEDIVFTVALTAVQASQKDK